MTIADYSAVFALLSAMPGVGLGNVDSRDGVDFYLRRNPGLSFVAEAPGGLLVGCLFAGHDGRRGYLNHLAVVASYRRLGLGKALVACCVEALKREGIRKVHIDVFANNELGLTFWHAIGFHSRDDLRRLSFVIGDDVNA